MQAKVNGQVSVLGAGVAKPNHHNGINGHCANCQPGSDCRHENGRGRLHRRLCSWVADPVIAVVQFFAHLATTQPPRAFPWPQTLESIAASPLVHLETQGRLCRIERQQAVLQKEPRLR